MNKNRGCLTCKYASYRKNATGKLKKNTPVKCSAKPPSPEAIESALRPIVATSMMPHYTSLKPWPFGMWPDQDDDGADCGAWEVKE